MNERLQGALIGAALTLALVAGAPAVLIAAQSSAVPAGEAPSPERGGTPPAGEFQTIRVGEGPNAIDYQVDPFFITASFPIQRVERIGKAASITYQVFVRDGSEMVDAGLYTTDDSGVMADVELGQALLSAPESDTAPEVDQP